MSTSTYETVEVPPWKFQSNIQIIQGGTKGHTGTKCLCASDYTLSKQDRRHFVSEKKDIQRHKIPGASLWIKKRRVTSDIKGGTKCPYVPPKL